MRNREVNMKQMVCEMCGGKELIKQDGVFVCQNCQVKYSVEEAKKMMVETDAPVKLENALKNARKAMGNKNYEQAEKYYDIVQMEDPENWEANFYSIYSKAMRANLLNISQATYSITNSIKTVLKDIKKLDDTIQQNEAIKQINTDLSTLATQGYNCVINFYNSEMDIYDDNSFFASAISDIKLSCANNILPFADMLTFFGKELVSEFGKNEFTDLINIQCHEAALKMVKDLYKLTDEQFFDSNTIDFLQKYTDELKKIKPSPKPLNLPEKQNSPSLDLDSFTTPKKTEKSFFTKPLAPNGCGCGCLPALFPAFFTTPIFIITFIVLIAILAIITPEGNQTQNTSNIGDQKIKAQVQLEQAIKANLREPKSYQNTLIDVWTLEEYIFVKNTFRGKNRYGGYEVCTFVAQFNFNAKPPEWEITNKPSSDNGCRAIMIALP